ncbi:hypothetical protein ACH4SP_22275 [Streptomyces sp. NPDC021093]|uniref:hypothetical protein n=1 Tax=Streptomyces sp. NPDC021093 TaxID=3365112 RepID=UPI00379385A3
MAQDISLKAAAKAMIAVGQWRDTVVERMHKKADKGASIVEYAGLVVIIALIVVAVKGTNLGALIAGALTAAVGRITAG